LLKARAGVSHAFFTRRGGVSQGLYHSLNLGRGSRDDPAHVAENRRRAAAVFGAEPGALNICFQVHSPRVLAASGFWGEDRPEGDGVASTVPGLICGALAADCAPILLADRAAPVVAAVHAGWRGALGGVIAAALDLMTDLGARRERIIAAIGPCIGPDSYEVGLDFLDRFEREAPGAARFFRPGRTAEKRFFDLPGFALERLREGGVEAAEWIGRDTYGEPETFFSNRRAAHAGDPDYGRLLSAIALNP
jgi:YfiH family protein